MKKKKKKNRYSLNQSPLFKCKSHRKLSQILGVELPTLKKVKSKGDDNYFFSRTPGKDSRQIHVPKPQLRRIHARLQVLLSRIETPDYLNSGVVGRSNVKNAKDHLGEKYIYRLDIKDYYNSTGQDLVIKCFRKLFCCSRDVAETLGELCCVRGHIPTGSPISQSLSFFVNKGAFDYIYEYSEINGIKFTIYVDDITFSGDYVSPEFIDHVCVALKKRGGYKCHKFKRYKPDTCKLVTGAVISGDCLKVRNRQRENIYKLLRQLDHYVEGNDYQSVETENYFQRLTGHLFSAGQINGRYYQKGKEIVELRRELGINAVNQNSS